jgi:superoxide dismutase, Fe-Mn family
MTFTLPALPFAKDALGKFMSAETLDFHHGKHHKAYVDKANALIAEQGIEARSLVDLIRKAKEQGDKGLFDNAAQIWNHSFFWQCLAPPEGQRPSGKLAAMIEEDFGTTEQLLAKLQEEAVGHFASGWAWLVLDGGKLRIASLHDADTPAVHDGMKPLLTLDLWEHAYYIDYRNERPRFAESVLGNILNWEFVGRNLDGEGLDRADQEAGALAEA